jgi:hypothetical protein
MKTIKLLIITICITMLCACSGSSGSSSNSATTSPTFSAVGGTGSSGIGGAGGQFYVESDAAINVLKSGSADASFTMPDTSTYNFGTNGYTVSGSEQILLDTAVPAGYSGLYVIDNDTHGTPDNWNLYKADGTGSAGIPGGYGTSSPVTGLSVPSGATLTISADSYYYSGSSYYGAYIVLTNDVVIDGTLQTAAGYNYIWFDNSSSYTASLPANVVVTGTVTTSGAENGWITFEAGKHIYNSGTLDASGSDNSTGDGNDSEGIWLYAYTGSVYSKGTIKSDGGNGGNGSGGAGAYYIEIFGGYAEDTYVDPVNGGSVVLSGTVEAKGGNAGGTTGGNGGIGSGDVDSYIVALGGDLIVNATFTLNGGNGSGSGKGGDAEAIEFYVFGMDYRRVGTCQISGSFNLNGGNGVTGGAGGYVDFYSYNWDDGNFGSEDTGNGVGQAPDMQLLGFSNINLNGGNGTTAGGNANKNAYELYTYAPWDDYDSYYLPAYPIVSEANVSAKGGDASAASGTGGKGGFADIEVDEDDSYYDYMDSISATELITQSGTIDVSGGNATASGGTGGGGGTIYLDYDGYDYTTTTTGILIANGGNGALQGGNGGYIEIDSDVTNAVYTLANLSVTGGAGTTAGSSGTADVNGTQVLP